MADRITGLLLMAFTLWFGWTAWGIERGFFSDPLGSRPFPLAVAILLAPLALYLILRPASGLAIAWPDAGLWRSLLLTVGAFGLYIVMMEPFGFIVANSVAFFLLALIFRATPPKALIASLIATAIIYVLFGNLLRLYLPTGELFEAWF